MPLIQPFQSLIEHLLLQNTLIVLHLLQEIIPIINWETKTFTRPVLGLLVFASVALFPTIFLPSSPSMWVAGMTFGYGYGFLLIIGASAIGVSLPYFIGSLFHHKIQVCGFSFCFHLFIWFSVIFLVYIFTFISSLGSARKISKESFCYKTSWWRELEKSATSCCLDQDFSFSVHYLQLLCSGNRC